MASREVKTEISRQTKRVIRRAQIIDAALKRLAYEGYASFTLRNIADKAGITLGAVQYYFRNKSDLLFALTEYKLQLDYLATEDARKKSTTSPETEFLAVINLLLRDNKKPLIYGLDFQLFALACSDSTAAKCVDKFYETVRHWIESLIKPLNPKLTDDECKIRAVLVLSMIEGLMQVVYRDKRNGSDLKNIEEIVRKEVLRIVNGTS